MISILISESEHSRWRDHVGSVDIAIAEMLQKTQFKCVFFPCTRERWGFVKKKLLTSPLEVGDSVEACRLRQVRERESSAESWRRTSNKVTKFIKSLWALIRLIGMSTKFTAHRREREKLKFCTSMTTLYVAYAFSRDLTSHSTTIGENVEFNLFQLISRQIN